METLIRRRVLQHLIWVCTVCQFPFYRSPDYNGLRVEKKHVNINKCSLFSTGDGESHHLEEEADPLPNIPVTKTTNTSDEPLAHTSKDPASVPAKTTTPQKPIIARPKEPPPPLPKTPPKGPVSQKTPPPLPKHPPKGQGGVKTTDTCRKIPSDKSVEISDNTPPSVKSDSKKDISLPNDLKEDNLDKNSNKTKWNFREPKTSVSPPGPIKPKPRRKTIDTVQTSHKENTRNESTKLSEEVNRNKSSLLERAISIGKSTWFHASLDEGHEQNCEELNVELHSTLTKQPDDKTDNKCSVFERETSIGNSTFIDFVKPENQCVENRLQDTERNKTAKDHSKVTFQKENDLSGSFVNIHPAPIRTPPPVPKKHHRVSPPVTNTANIPEPNSSDITSATNSHKQSSSCDNHKIDKGDPEFKETRSEAGKQESAINDQLKSFQPSAKPRTSVTSIDSLDKPKPIPRKPIPAVKPRPTPKKRSFINRLSGSEEFSQTQSLTGSLDNLSLNSKYNLEISDQNHKTEDHVSKDIGALHNIKSAVHKKTVCSVQGQEKQYRVIDKSILGESNQNTALDKPGDKIATDKKDSFKNALDPSVSLSVVELRRKFKESKQSEKPAHAQIVVPNADDDDSQKVNVTPGKKEESKSSSDHTPSSLKGSFEDLLSDKSILEPSSLLNEIEEILSRSYKHSSLTRSGSSPEKRGISLYKDNLDIKSERSQSLDLSSEQKTSTPIRPPRPKKEAKRLRSRSQIIYDTCVSDTESLPDLSIDREEHLLSLKDDFSKTLGPAKPHPPKPKRNKLLKVQRSHSDITKMKSFLDQKEMEGNKISSHKRHLSDAKSDTNNKASPGNLKAISGSHSNSSSSDQVKTRAKRPTRQAPLPPCKAVTKAPSTNLNMVVPVDSQMKSKNVNKKSSQRRSVEDTAGSIYDSINDAEVPYSSDEDHDYHEIPEHLKQGISDSDSRSKSGSPPKLPPRNYSSSNSFDSSSQSGFVCDISIVDGTSSTEDLSVSSAILKTDSGSRTNSPSLKRMPISKPLPSPLLHRKLEEIQTLDKSGLMGSNSSIPESLDGSIGSRTRPVSNASEMTVTSSESEGEDEETKVIS